VATAEAQVALAAGQMLEVQAGIETAESQVEIAKRQYAELSSHPTPAELKTAAADVAVAETAVSQTQAAYNLVRGDPQILARPESLALQQATASFEAAQARADQIRQGATPEQLSVASGQVDAAETEVNAAKSLAPGAEAGVQAAMAERDSAQAALDQLLTGATKEDIDMAEARVLSAQAALATAQALLDQSQIVAPFDGQVGTINVRTGELATPERFLLLLGDARQMHVETTDLRETDVVRLHVDMPVEVTFDALPEEVFQGTIKQIAPVSNTEKGSTNYTVKIDVDDLDESLRWGMTAFVNIEAPR
jgi:multidrug efflux pump subunit AcrA (membrane-fusion protein)